MAGGFQTLIIRPFELHGRDVSDGFEQAAVVEPVDPFQGSELHVLEAAPRATPADQSRDRAPAGGAPKNINGTPGGGQASRGNGHAMSKVGGQAVACG